MVSIRATSNVDKADRIKQEVRRSWCGLASIGDCCGKRLDDDMTGGM